MTPQPQPQPLPVRVRAATRADLDEYAVQGPGGIYRESFEAVLDEAAAGRATVLVAQCEAPGRGLCGRLVLQFPPRGEPAELSALVVVEQHRRRGVGSALMAGAHTAAEARGCERIRLTVGMDNRTAYGDLVRWYERLGYDRTGTSVTSGLTSSDGVVVHEPEPVWVMVRTSPDRSAVSGSVRRRIVVHGRVQGVFYRDTCRRIAADQGLVGWVRNLADGTVEAVFEGPPAAVEAAVRWAAHGPPGADVASLDSYEEPPAGPTTFVVR